MWKSGALKGAAFVFLAAIVVRLILWMALGDVRPIDFDQKDYGARARILSEQHQFLNPDTGRQSAYRDPGFITLLSILLMTGTSVPTGVILFQILLSCLTGAILYIIACREAGSLAAQFTAVLFLVHLTFASYCFLLYSETTAALATSLLLLSLSLWRRRSDIGRQILAGLAASALVLTRASLLPAVLALLIVTLTPWRTSPRFWMLPFIILVAFTSLWCLRNGRDVGAFTLNTNGPINIYFGNSERTPMTHSYRAMTDTEMHSAIANSSEAIRAESAMGRVIDYVTHRPGRALAGALFRIPDTLEFDRILVGVSRLGQFPERSPRALLGIGLLIVLFSAIPMVAALGSIACRERTWIWSAGWTIFAGTIAVQLISIAHSRFTLPGWMALIPAGGVALAELKRSARVRWGFVIGCLLLSTVWLREIWIDVAAGGG